MMYSVSSFSSSTGIGFIPLGGPGLTEHLAGPTLWDFEDFRCMVNALAPGRAQKSPSAASFSIWLSGARSTTAFLSLVYASSLVFRTLPSQPKSNLQFGPAVIEGAGHSLLAISRPTASVWVYKTIRRP
jgi:hypothetical protein